MVWPMCQGRDVEICIKGEFLAISVSLSPLGYTLLLILFSVHKFSYSSNINRKNSQHYLVESNCDKGARAKGLKSPSLEEYAFFPKILIICLNSSINIPIASNCFILFYLVIVNSLSYCITYLYFPCS